jgi:ATP phosphoribosyltransferase
VNGNPIKVALPKGRFLEPTASLLQKAGWGFTGYQENARLYRMRSHTIPGLYAKMFRERDIPVQVAVGNYDLGICGSDWLEELQVKYPSSAVLKLAELGYVDGMLYVAGGVDGVTTVAAAQAQLGAVRIAGEYPNLAESFALKTRLKRFAIFPLWGGAEVYPPETADLALVPGTPESLARCGLAPLAEVLRIRACLIANRRTWESRDLSEVLTGLYRQVPAPGSLPEVDVAGPAIARRRHAGMSEDTVWLALPDGHQQVHTSRLLDAAGIRVDDYPSQNGNRRLTAEIPGVAIKVIRPQDMPLQVANGNFDLAISGTDWLTEHLYQFPTSPVTRLLDLKLGRVRIVAVIHQGLAAGDIGGLRDYCAGRSQPLRVASEYTNIADRYARDNHLGLYRVVPTWGATEAFLPEDADLLIENTETGQTIARHNLKIIDTLFESTACLIGSTRKVASPARRRIIEYIVTAVKKGAEGI